MPPDVLRHLATARSGSSTGVEPEEVATMVGYLCGHDAGFITGSSMVMDGGWTAR